MGVACAAPFALLALPESLSNAIVGTWAFLAFGAALAFFCVSGVLSLMHWWGNGRARVAAVDRTLDEMGYAKTRNAKQQMGGRHGRP